MYYYGYGVSRDRAEAYHLFQEAAAQGNRMLSGRLSVPERGFQSIPVRAFWAFNESETSFASRNIGSVECQLMKTGVRPRSG